MYIPRKTKFDPDNLGHFGKYGGRFTAETLMPALLELEKAYFKIREDKKALIMQVALELFASNGIQIPISKIADRAGVSKGLMYNYFESKEALLKLIIGEGLKGFLGIFSIYI